MVIQIPNKKLKNWAKLNKKDIDKNRNAVDLF
jgi:hypothetical protein